MDSEFLTPRSTRTRRNRAPAWYSQKHWQAANLILHRFLNLDGKDPQSVSADGKQLCVDGLKHGQRYTLQVRAGLPSSVDEPLLKTVDLTIGVRDRAPTVRAQGRAYVLPNRDSKDCR